MSDVTSSVVPASPAKLVCVEGTDRGARSRSTRKLKILHVTPLYEPAWNAGGIVRSLSLLCRSLVRLGHEVDVVATDSDGMGHLDVPRSNPVEVAGVRVHYVHTQMPRQFRYARQMRHCLSTLVPEADIVHITSFWNYPGFAAAKICRREGIPYVVSTRGTFLPAAMARGTMRKWLYLKLFDEKVLEGATAYHFTSDLERKRTQKFRVHKASVLIPNGSDFSGLKSRPSREEARKSLGLAEGDFVVGFLGRLHQIKALDVLIEALELAVRNGGTRLRAVIAGPDDGAESQLRRLVTQKGLSDKVQFLGMIHGAQKNTFLSSLDILSLVSWSENFGNAAAEAMASEVPVIVSENVGIGDTVQEDGSGIVVPVAAEAIANAFISLMGDRERLQIMGKAAQISAWNRFEADAVSTLMATAYTDILCARRSPECRWCD